MTEQTKKLFIPDKIKVGYVNREGTYTGKLAFVIFFDKAGVLRKEKSWEGWRDKKISPNEFNNEPTEGFVLNKGVGGVRHSYSHHARNEYIRVYDPRDFEFEISVANLLFILRECDCSRGKGLEGKFVYSWDGQQLVLLPVNSQDYKASQDFTELQGKAISIKDLIKGATYRTKTGEDYIYLGRYDRYKSVAINGYGENVTADKKKAKDRVHAFWDIDKQAFYFPSGMNRFAVCVNETPVANFAELVDTYYNSPCGSPVEKLILTKVPKKTKSDPYSREPVLAYEDNGEILRYLVTTKNYGTKGVTFRQFVPNARVEDGLIVFDTRGEYYEPVSYPPDMPETEKLTDYHYLHHHLNAPIYKRKIIPWKDNVKSQILVAVLKSGAQYEVGYHQLQGENLNG